jgi:hypothetical protein
VVTPEDLLTTLYWREREIAARLLGPAIEMNGNTQQRDG